MTKWKGKTRGGVLGYLFFIYLIKKIGIKAAYFFLGNIVLYFIPFAPKATRSVWFYSRKILKNNILKSVKMLFSNYYRFGQTLIDKIAIGNGMKDQYRFLFDNYNKFIDLLNAETGLIIIGAHVGNWEIGTPFFDDYGKKINIVLYDAEYEKIKKLLENNTVNSDFKVIPVNTSNLDHIFSIKEALDNKEYVCFQGDRYLNEERCLSRQFMGREAKFPLGPFLLASKMNVPVVFYFSMREPKMTYNFYFTIAHPVKKEKGEKAEYLILDQYVSALEDILKEHPEQWFNYFEFWKN